MPFLHLRDPLFLTAFFLYGLNRVLIKPYTDIRFFHHYFNDLICIPLFVPILVFIARVTGLRDHDQPPQFYEIVLPLMVWSILFELLFPQHRFWSQWVVGDPYDVLWYSTGALIASIWWRRRYCLPMI